MSAITAKASRKMKKYAVLTREPRCFLGSFDFSWEQRKLGDVVQITMGQSPDGSTYSDEPSDYILVQGNADLQNGWVCPRIWTTQITKKADAGDLIMSVRAPAGAMGKTAYNAVIGRGVAAIKGNEFIYQLLVKMDADGFWKTLSCGSTFESLNSDNIKNAEVKIPTTAEQIKIGGYFQQLDNLITLHQRKCVFLFGFFQAFISMIFTASTFSWEQRKLGEMGQTYTGLSGKTKDDFGHGQARFVTYMNVFSNPISNPEMTEPIEIDPKQNEVEVGDVFFTTSSETPEEVGMSSILLEKRGKTYLNSFCFGFRPSEKIDSYYLAYMLRSESTRAKIILLAQGISRYNISKNKVMEIAVSLPSLDEQKMIGQYFSQLDNLITLHQRECISFTARAGRLILTANKKRNTSSWEQRKFSDITFPAGEKNKDNLPLESYSITNEHGFVPQDEKFENGGTMREADKRMYYIVSPNSFAYNPARINVGSIGYQNIGKNVIVSSLYEVFKTSEDVDDRLLWHWFKSSDFQKLIMQLQEGGVRLYFYYDKLCMGEVSLPSLDEQRKIGKLFDTLDNLITLHQRKPFLMKWRTSDANRNQTNRLVL